MSSIWGRIWLDGCTQNSVEGNRDSRSISDLPRRSILTGRCILTICAVQNRRIHTYSKAQVKNLGHHDLLTMVSDMPKSAALIMPLRPMNLWEWSFMMRWLILARFRVPTMSSIKYTKMPGGEYAEIIEACLPIVRSETNVCHGLATERQVLMVRHFLSETIFFMQSGSMIYVPRKKLTAASLILHRIIGIVFLII